MVRLEFSSKPWVLFGQSAESFRFCIGNLCELIQVDLQGLQLGKMYGQGDITSGTLDLRTDIENLLHYATELEHYRLLFSFPEEIALRLARTEMSLFLKVPPASYLRYATQESLKPLGTYSPSAKMTPRIPSCFNASQKAPVVPSISKESTSQKLHQADWLFEDSVESIQTFSFTSTHPTIFLGSHIFVNAPSYFKL